MKNKKNMALVVLMICMLMLSGCNNGSSDKGYSMFNWRRFFMKQAVKETQAPTEEETTIPETQVIASTELESLLETAEEIDGGDPDEVESKEAELDAGDPDEEDTDVVTTPAAAAITTVTGKSFSDSAGYKGFECTATGTYTFQALESEGVEWKVYVMDEEFQDGLRYIGHAYDPALEGDGSIEIKEGQYFYIYCSANAFTGSEAPKNCQYFFQMK